MDKQCGGPACINRITEGDFCSGRCYDRYECIYPSKKENEMSKQRCTAQGCQWDAVYVPPNTVNIYLCRYHKDEFVSKEFGGMYGCRCGTACGKQNEEQCSLKATKEKQVGTGYCTECGNVWDTHKMTCKTKGSQMDKQPKLDKIHSTTVEVKQKYWPKFAEMNKNQFKHGGEKYALKGFPDMEATDLICKLWEEPGTDEIKWIMKTCMKYMFRFQNFHREKDLLKISTYMYIIWLKMGFHLQNTHDEDVKK